MIDEKRLDELRNAAQPGKPAGGYHGLPLLKKPVWTWEVPLYFFVGGTAGSAAVIALTAQMARADRKIVRDARRIALAGAVLSAPLLIADLGRPERFLYMLRIFKPQSAMSVGAWTLSIFGAAATGAALFEETVAGNIAAVFSGMTGAIMATYTGVLLGATSIPVWAKHAAVLPMHFAASAAGAASSTVQLFGHYDRSLRMIGLAASAAESYFAFAGSGRKSGAMMLAGCLAGPLPFIVRLLGGRSKTAQSLAAVSAIAGSLLTRFAWIDAGRESADKYHPVKNLD